MVTYPDGKVVKQLTITKVVVMTNVKVNLAEIHLKPLSANMVSKIISKYIVPIKVTHAETKREVSTLSALNNCGQGCFVKNSIRERLGESGRKTEMIINISNDDQDVASTVISGLKAASDMEGKGQQWLNLPATYTRE